MLGRDGWWGGGGVGGGGGGGWLELSGNSLRSLLRRSKSGEIYLLPLNAF